MELIPGGNHWIRAGGLPALLIAIIFSGVFYNRNLIAVPDQSYLHVFSWQLLAWLPWAVIIPLTRRYLDRDLDRRLPWAASSFFVAFACTIWYIVVSSLVSPYRGQPLTMFGLYKWWLIFWFAISFLMFWAQIGFHLLSTLTERLPRSAGDNQSRLAIWHGGNRVIINKEEITWIKAEDSYACIFLGETRKYWVRTRLNQLMKALAGGPFLRLHRSVIVNIGQLKKVCRNENGNWEAVLVDDTRVRVSRAGKAKLDEAINTIK